MTADFERWYPLAFFGTALVLLLLERFRALQRRPARIEHRWFSNVGLLVFGSFVSAAIVPLGFYAFAAEQSPGLLRHPGLPFAAQLVVTFLLLDFWKYWEHRAFHAFPPLWRLHLVHHSDTDVDVTTTERHHPLEIAVSTALLMALVALLGLPPLALGVYLLTASVVALCSHANLHVPGMIDRPLRRLFVTPFAHAVHHSDLRHETDSNFGAVLTVWDRWFGTYVEPERAAVPHFGLDYFHRPGDTRFARVLLQPFLYRRYLAYPPRDDNRHHAVNGASPTMVATWGTASGRALLCGAAGCALVTIAMWPALVGMIAIWLNNESYQYAWLVVPMLVYVVGWHWPAVEVRPDFSGVPVVAFAALCWIAATSMNVDVGRQLALVLALQGTAMSTFGWRSYRRLFPAFALLFLMIPSGDLLQPALRTLTLKSIEIFANVAGLPREVDGFAIRVGAQRYIVVDACSGLTYVTLVSFLGYCFGLMLYRSFVRVAALALFGAFVGFAANAARVNGIVLIDWLRGSQMDLSGHGAVQWIALLAGLAVLLLAVRGLTGEPDRTMIPASPHGKSGRPRFLAPIVAGAFAVIGTGTAFGLQSAALEPARTALPAHLGPWAVDRTTLSRVADSERGLDIARAEYFSADRRIAVLRMATLTAKAKLDESQMAPHDGAVWREKRASRESGCVDVACPQFVHAIWEREKTRQLRHVYYAYAIGDVVTASALVLRAARGARMLTGRRDPLCLIAIVADEPIDAAETALALGNLIATHASAENGYPAEPGG